MLLECWKPHVLYCQLLYWSFLHLAGRHCMYIFDKATLNWHLNLCRKVFTPSSIVDPSEIKTTKSCCEYYSDSGSIDKLLVQYEFRLNVWSYLLYEIQTICLHPTIVKSVPENAPQAILGNSKCMPPEPPRKCVLTNTIISLLSAQIKWVWFNKVGVNI